MSIMAYYVSFVNERKIMFIKLADWFVWNLLGISEVFKFGQALHFFVYDVIKILFLLFTIFTLVAFLRSYINNEKFKSFIEKQPLFLSHFCASIFGAITPFCSCSSIPVFIGFIESGLPFGVAMSFLITSPMINEIAIVVLVLIVGLKVTLIYLFTGIFVGVIGGILMEKFGFKKYLQDYLFKIEGNNVKTACNCTKIIADVSLKVRFTNSLIYAESLLKRIFVYVIFGVAVGAVLHGYVPQEFFIKYMQKDNLLAVPLAVICGI